VDTSAAFSAYLRERHRPPRSPTDGRSAGAVALFGALVALSERNTRLILRRLDRHDMKFAEIDGHFAELHHAIRDLERHMNVGFDVVNGRIDRLGRTM